MQANSDHIPIWSKKGSGGYGALTSTTTPTNHKLVYSWENIDVFGEAPQQSANACVSAFRACSPCHGAPVQRKHLLKNLYGLAKAGEVLAIMGSSGTGKTTLLNVLAFRSPTGIQVSSNAVRAINGIPVTATELRSRCAYVQQDDLFIGTLTPREHLIFQSSIVWNLVTFTAAGLLSRILSHLNDFVLSFLFTLYYLKSSAEDPQKCVVPTEAGESQRSHC